MSFYFAVKREGVDRGEQREGGNKVNLPLVICVHISSICVWSKETKTPTYTHIIYIYICSTILYSKALYS